MPDDEDDDDDEEEEEEEEEDGDEDEDEDEDGDDDDEDEDEDEDADEDEDDTPAGSRPTTAGTEGADGSRPATAGGEAAKPPAEGEGDAAEEPVEEIVPKGPAPPSPRELRRRAERKKELFVEFQEAARVRNLATAADIERASAFKSQTAPDFPMKTYEFQQYLHAKFCLAAGKNKKDMQWNPKKNQFEPAKKHKEKKRV